MNFDHLLAAHWDHCSDAERQVLAQAVEHHLPAPFRLASVQRYNSGARQHSVAVYEYGQACFVLIPGAEVTLGYDPSQPFPATPQQRASWEYTVREFELTHTLDEDIAAQMTPLRTVALAPFLLEVDAHTAGQTPTETGVIERPLTHAQALAQVSAQGFRLPTSDEWEYACAAGTRTLFWWGNDYPHGGDGSDWAPLGPNGFGLNIAHDPYCWEFVAESHLMRGGDGGGAICGGAGMWASWLTLASAYLDVNLGSYWHDKPVHGAHLRRALSIA